MQPTNTFNWNSSRYVMLNHNYYYSIDRWMVGLHRHSTTIEHTINYKYLFLNSVRSNSAGLLLLFISTLLSLNLVLKSLFSILTNWSNHSTDNNCIENRKSLVSYSVYAICYRMPWIQCILKHYIISVYFILITVDYSLLNNILNGVWCACLHCVDSIGNRFQMLAVR